VKCHGVSGKRVEAFPIGAKAWKTKWIGLPGLLWVLLKGGDRIVKLLSKVRKEKRRPFAF